MAQTTRSERETVRPFVGIEATDAALDDVRLHIDDEEHEAGSVVLEPFRLSGSKMKIRLPKVTDLRAAIAKSKLAEEDCGLVVLGTSRTHRDAQILLEEKISAASYESDYLLKRSDADLILNDQNGFTLTIAIVLLHDIETEPLRPNMAGTWLARRVFNVSPEKEDNSFSPEELTEAIREQFRLPKGTLRFVAVDDVLSADAIGDAVHVYVDGEVLNLLLANPTEPLAVQMQIELAVLAMDVVAQTIVHELQDAVGHSPTEADLEPYEAPRRFFESLGRAFERSVNEVIDISATAPELLRPLLEDAFGIRSATSTALKEN
jgi:hypothetical protein